MSLSEKKKKNQLIIGVVVIAIIFIAIIGYGIRALVTPAVPIDTSVCDGLTDAGGVGNDAKSACYSKIAFNLENTKICDKISNPADPQNLRKSVCYGGIAAKHNSTDICNELPRKSTERAICYAQVGVAKRDFSLCDLAQEDKSSEVKDKCYIGIARLTQNVSVCTIFMNASTQEYCGRIVLGEILGRPL